MRDRPSSILLHPPDENPFEDSTEQASHKHALHDVAADQEVIYVLNERAGDLDIAKISVQYSIEDAGAFTVPLGCCQKVTNNRGCFQRHPLKLAGWRRCWN
ncbi:uncharacterized protein [Ambystoma mexicanum]|uniref:uncharacterized protein isoform X2 n=1 Tax=Ambystoma mexicanum TaxID=8296 RepID=UPI0037E838EB